MSRLDEIEAALNEGDPYKDYGPMWPKDLRYLLDVARAAEATIQACDCGRNPMYPETQVPHRYECATFRNNRRLVETLRASKEQGERSEEGPIVETAAEFEDLGANPPVDGEPFRVGWDESD